MHNKRNVWKQRRKYGFTLIEMMVVIAIIATLAALLFPVFSRVRSKGRQTVCLSNVRQLSIALSAYVQDYDGKFPGNGYIAPINEGNEQTPPPYDYQLRPYVKNDSIYACPQDAVTRIDDQIWDGSYKGKLLKRSYSLTGHIRTQEGVEKAQKQDEDDENTGVTDRALAEITQPADTITFAETWGRYVTMNGNINPSVVGAQQGASLFGCDTWELPGRKKPSDALIDTFKPCKKDYTDPNNLPSQGHFDLGVYAFVDGHVKTLTWSQIRVEDFALFKAHKSERSFVP